ncbi:PREDICTED: G-type lectin S-receptor-like serine/threonine-protein kinase At1g34300 [Ipomoea nil]|uniref:G-type lectin S-receptor-like serine/threonine-protein kinase At1g34300 n=1 Tax=Ipomoea nil TaxID=35883 RepID=UPI0009019FE7|nr:PREDICTED: G-type lectin S-receptor-like serine/threonine-protein kinase At1g34300 [Ipomoea nil]
MEAPSSTMSLPTSIFFFFLVILLFIPQFTSSQQHPKIIHSFSSSNPPWTPTQNQILISPNSTFAAGFHPSDSAPNRFVFSVWYYNLSSHSPRAVVWSANENHPVNSSGQLFITPAGELNFTAPSGFGTAREAKAKLLIHDNGSLAFGRWESFSNPTDTILPLQPINGTIITSKNGKFKFLKSNLIFAEKNDSYWTVNNGEILMLDEQGSLNQIGPNVMYCSDYGQKNLRRLVLDNDGNLRVYAFDRNSGNWTAVWQAIYQLCHVHGACGNNSICMYDVVTAKTSCVCPPGFRKKTSSDDSCERKTTMSGKTKFLSLDFVNFTGGANQTDLKAGNFTDCRKKCLDEKNCLGFMMKYDGTGYCVLQLETLDYGFWSPGTETVMFLRVDSSETDVSNFTGMTGLMKTSCPVRISLPPPPKESKATARNIAIITTIFAAELISGVFFFWAFLKKYIKYRDMARTFGLEVMPAVGPKRFSFSELKDATKDFSEKIGRGGYGDVYRGKLSDGRSVAVKCLKNVAGGDSEFWAEVTIIARMHHLNLVRLWGFCAEKGKRILVYEYVPNGSLDKFLFRPVLVGGGSSDKTESAESESPISPQPEPEPEPVLDWNIRYRIALGVARAIAYLHEECLEWVLHCDIKPENILLGDDFWPKVSDFGLAKLKKKEEIMTMSRFRGTPGYIAPEWMRADPITPKADVYSFGLVLLEIVCGARNFDQCTSKVDSDLWFLPSWAFDKVYKEMNVEDILDPRIKHSYDTRAHFEMVNRMVKTAMWCLQDRADQRPSMGKVAKMLEGTVEIIEPKRPSIFYLPPEEQ